MMLILLLVYLLCSLYVIVGDNAQRSGQNRNHCLAAKGILISIYIIYTWIMTGYEQVEMIVGKGADPEVLSFSKGYPPFGLFDFVVKS